MKCFACAAGALLLFVPGLFAQDNKWIISPNDSLAHFTVKHLMISKVQGTIGGMKGAVVYDPKDPSKDSVEATLDAGSFKSGVDKRDDQVKNDYFEVAKYPAITFQSTKVASASDGGLTVTGNLTIKGTTRQVVLNVDPPSPPVKDPQGRTKIGITATTKISRKDYGIIGTALDGAVEAGGIVVSDEVAIELDLELMRPSQAGIVGPAKH
ncbi:MAG TPA: YceI family protein [Bryobacteraceae bacterium]|nr:YceI family protein [Bryobacteraceae bacterium]